METATERAATVRVAEALAEHPAVRRASVRAAGHGLVAYVEVAPDLLSSRGPAATHLLRWRTLWSEVYGTSREPRDPSLHLAGWISSYTGMPIRETEMKEWVERTVERLLDPAPRRVLEIGCGTGMLLLRVACRCPEAVATDFSPEALAYVRGRLDAEGLSHVTLLQRDADDFTGLDEARFDLVVLNSVVQYFPSLDYLLRVLAGAVAAAARGGRIFLGDLRSLPLLEAFHVSVQLQQADAATPLDELRERVQTAVSQERELVINPALFAALPGMLPGVDRVEVQLKRGRARNELTRFRYDAVLHLTGGSAAGPEPQRWLERGDPDAAPAALRRRLAAEAPPLLGVRRVPNARLAAEVEALRLLREGGTLRTVGDLQEALRRARPAGVEPEEFWSLERELPYRVEIRWADDGAEGLYDVLLRHREKTGEPVRPAAAPSVKPAVWANRPLRERGEPELTTELEDFLRGRLPEELVPVSLVLLDKLPPAAASTTRTTGPWTRPPEEGGLRR
jgi:SAM-dependent methyltransferase